MSVVLRSGARPRMADLWGLAFSAMRQQKVRTALTLIGVVVGTLALVLSVAVGRGIDRAIVNLFHSDDRLRKITVHTKFEENAEYIPADQREPKGAMSDAKRARIRQAIERSWGGVRKQRNKLTPDALRKLAAIEHVASVVPNVRFWNNTTVSLDGKAESVWASSAEPTDRYFRDRLIAGRLFAPDDGRVALVHEYLLYRWGLTSDSDAESAVGRTFRLEIRTQPPETFDLTWVLRGRDGKVSEGETRALESALRRLAGLVRFLPIPGDERDVLRELFEHVSATSKSKPSRTYSEEFTIVGVLREHTEKDPVAGFWANGNHTDDVLIPTAAAAALWLRSPEAAENGFESAMVTVDQEDVLKEVDHEIARLGYNTFSLAEFIGTVRLNVLLVSTATAFVAIVALLVAAIGITNTMIMSVLERTHEIGIMKALGARDGHIRLIFVVEGVLMGLVGGGIGLTLGWLASFPGDSIAKSLMEPQTHEPVKETLFAFPIWLVLGVPALVCLITTLAAWYPASRAARVDPVTSLRHE